MCLRAPGLRQRLQERGQLLRQLEARVEGQFPDPDLIEKPGERISPFLPLLMHHHP